MPTQCRIIVRQRTTEYCVRKHIICDRVLFDLFVCGFNGTVVSSRQITYCIYCERSEYWFSRDVYFFPVIKLSGVKSAPRKPANQNEVAFRFYQRPFRIQMRIKYRMDNIILLKTIYGRGLCLYFEILGKCYVYDDLFILKRPYLKNVYDKKI